MAIQITKQEVLNNLIRFKDKLLTKRERKSESVSPKREYIALVHRNTGEIQFAQQVEAPKGQRFNAFNIKGDVAGWKEIHLVAEDAQRTVHFHLTGPQGSALKPTELDPLAVRILFETLDVLNQLASQCLSTTETLPENMVLQHLSELHVSRAQDTIESMQGWSGQLSRLEAEKRLFGSPVGTYLLRTGDKLTNEVAKAFAAANKMPVKIYVLTFVEEKEKISDRLLIKTQWGWTIARDDSDLSSSLYEYHQSVNALINSMSDQFKTPI